MDVPTAGGDDDEAIPRFQFGMQTAPEGIPIANLETTLESYRRQLSQVKPVKTSQTLKELVSYVEQREADDHMVNPKKKKDNPWRSGGKCTIS